MLRAIGRTPGIERVVSVALRARIVRERGRFFWRELLPGVARGRPRRYRLRTSGVPVWLEHRTPDAHTLDELWHSRVYEPPADVDLGVLGPTPRVVDLGANVGMFVAWLTDRGLRPHVVAYEPDPRNADLLHATLAALDDRLTGWEVRLGAAGASDRDIAFAPGGFSASRAAADGRQTVRCWDVLPALADCDLVRSTSRR